MPNPKGNAIKKAKEKVEKKEVKKCKCGSTSHDSKGHEKWSRSPKDIDDVNPLV